MRSVLYRTLLPALLVLAGCSDDGRRYSSPTAPDPLSPATPQPAPIAWTGDMVFVDVSGPEENCMVRGRRAEIGHGWFDEILLVTVDENSYRITYSCDEGPGCTYSGPLEGLRFSAAGFSSSGTWTCSENESLPYDLRSGIEGAFAPDLKSFTAIERWIYRVAEGEIVVSLEWRAHES